MSIETFRRGNRIVVGEAYSFDHSTMPNGGIIANMGGLGGGWFLPPHILQGLGWSPENYPYTVNQRGEFIDER